MKEPTCMEEEFGPAQDQQNGSRVRNLWAIPDVHGRLDLLTDLTKKLLEDHELDMILDKLVFMGDMIDRGPDSKGVLDFVRKLSTQYPNNVVVLAGNHEWLMIDGISKTYDQFQLWMMNGGNTTLWSFGEARQVPKDYILWLASLPLSHEEDGFFFSHAPVPPEEDRNSALRGKPFSKQELIWTYHMPEDKHARKFDDKVGVCGHVHALNRGLREPRLYDHYIFSDAGCGCSETAPLVAIEVKSRKVVYAWPTDNATPQPDPQTLQQELGNV